MSVHFTLDEMTHSDVARQMHLMNIPNYSDRLRIEALCNEVLEPIRDLLGVPMTISSGYRTEEVNRLVRGEPNSQHITGDAADFIPAGMDLDEAFMRIAESGIKFDQLISEKKVSREGVVSRWLHVSRSSSGEGRLQCLIAVLQETQDATGYIKSYRTYQPGLRVAKPSSPPASDTPSPPSTGGSEKT